MLYVFAGIVNEVNSSCDGSQAGRPETDVTCAKSLSGTHSVCPAMQALADTSSWAKISFNELTNDVYCKQSPQGSFGSCCPCSQPGRGHVIILPSCYAHTWLIVGQWLVSALSISTGFQDLRKTPSGDSVSVEPQLLSHMSEVPGGPCKRRPTTPQAKPFHHCSPRNQTSSAFVVPQRFRGGFAGAGRTRNSSAHLLNPKGSKQRRIVIKLILYHIYIISGVIRCQTWPQQGHLTPTNLIMISRSVLLPQLPKAREAGPHTLFASSLMMWGAATTPPSVQGLNASTAARTSQQARQLSMNSSSTSSATALYAQGLAIAAFNACCCWGGWHAASAAPPGHGTVSNAGVEHLPAATAAPPAVKGMLWVGGPAGGLRACWWLSIACLVMFEVFPAMFVMCNAY